MADEKYIFQSKEARWFFQKNPTTLEQWFNDHKVSFETESERSDFYLNTQPQEDISYKIREGKSEIKMRTQDEGVQQFPNGHTGKTEWWVKWSLPLKEKIMNPAQLYASDENNFFEVRKKRVLVKFEVLHDGTLKQVGNKVFPSEGCQVELTRIFYNEEKWYSFGFEAFGSVSQIDRSFVLGSETVLKGISSPTLTETMSFSYPAFFANNK